MVSETANFIVRRRGKGINHSCCLARIAFEPTIRKQLVCLHLQATRLHTSLYNYWQPNRVFLQKLHNNRACFLDEKENRHYL